MNDVVDGATYPVPGSTAHIDDAFLADRAAILDLVAAYGIYYDSGDFETLGDLFTEEASFVLNPPPEGFPQSITTRAHIVQALSTLYRQHTVTRGVYHRHVTTNTVIDRIDGATADTRSLLVVVLTSVDDQQELGPSGFYLDHLEKRGHRWRIASRNLRFRDLPRVTG